MNFDIKNRKVLRFKEIQRSKNKKNRKKYIFNKNFKRMYKVQTQMRKHYEELFTTSLQQSQFDALQKDHLLSILEEVVAILKNDDPLICKIINNGLEKYQLDKLVHTRTIF